jgi:RNA polymerase sigma-70 factor (ECF subfamily)
VVGDPDLAEDVFQDALFKVWQRVGDCRSPERFGPWLAQAVRRHALNALRARRPTVRLDGQLGVEDPGAGPARRAEQSNLQERLLAALAELSPEQRQVALLFDLEGWSHAEIAQSLGTSEGMSRQHLMLARRRLRKLLADPEEGP